MPRMTMEEWKKENLVSYRFAVSKNTGLPDALKVAAKDRHLKPNLYIRRIVEERLTQDGYWQPKEEEEE